MANDELKRIRQEIAKRRRAATAKVNRVQRSKGISLAGTNIDPRKEVGHENKLNLKQAQTYLSKLDTFASRNTQFEKGKKGKIIDGVTWHRIEHLTSRLEKKVQAEKEALAQYHPMMTAQDESIVPNPDMTVRDKRDNLAKKPTAISDKYSYYSVYRKTPQQFEDNEKLELLRINLIEQLSPQYIGKKRKQAREHVMKALITMGELDIMEGMHALSNKQFDILWADPEFRDTLFMKYGYMQAQEKKSPKERRRDAAVDAASGRIRDMVEYAGEYYPKR